MSIATRDELLELTPGDDVALQMNKQWDQGMNTRKAIGLGLLLGVAMSGQAAEPAKSTAKAQAVPAEISAKKACQTSQGATKTECEKVAAKIDAHTANPQAHPDVESNRASPEYVQHSSPAMVTPEEKAASEATRREMQKADKAKEAAAEKAAESDPPKK